MIAHASRLFLRQALWSGVLVIGLMLGAQAHEIRPALLEITESDPGIVKVLWKVPVLGTKRLHICL